MLQSMLYPATIYALMLFVPGYLWLRCFRLPRAYALCCAPVISTALVAVLGEIYAILHIPATPLSIYCVAILPALIAFIVLSRRWAAQTTRNDEQEKAIISHPDIIWWMPLVAVLVGIFVCNDLFVSELPSVNAVMQNYDVQHHLNATRAFANAKSISSLRLSFYLTDADKAIVPFGSASFYPAVWYGQCSLLMQATGIATPEALNVALFVSNGIAYPLGMCALAASLFRERRHTVFFCALTAVSFATFPWCMLIFGPLYANLVGFNLLPSTVTLCKHAFLSGPSVRKLLPAWALAFAALIGQAFLHPNTLFSALLILAPFATQGTYNIAKNKGLSTVKSIAAAAGFAALCVGFWVFCYKLPQFSVVTSEMWWRFAYSWQEVINILTQTYTLFFFTEITAQVLLGVLVIIGFVRCAYNQKTRWLCASYLIICGINFISATSFNATLKRLLAGFWYTDAMRLAAMAILVAALFAAYGLDWIFELSCVLLDRHNERLERTTHPRIVLAVLAVCFYVINFMPGFCWPGAHAESTKHIDEYRMEEHEYDSMSVKTTFGDYKKKLRDSYSFNEPIDVHEVAFLEQVKEIVGDDLVINNPYDGSSIAYGMYNIQVYYRKSHGFGYDSETKESFAIRQKLASMATDDEVRQAVKTIGAHYVMVLDKTYSQQSFLKIRSKTTDDSYGGIEKVITDTPGFTEILSSGSCRLYRIDD